jgi:hypothetical protein
MTIEIPIDKDFSNKSSDSSQKTQDQLERPEIFEPYLWRVVIHDGEQCRSVLGCKICTPKTIVEELEEKRRQWWKERKHSGATTIEANDQRDYWDPTVEGDWQ